jgi:hypothetical protein
MPDNYDGLALSVLENIAERAGACPLTNQLFEEGPAEVDSITLNAADEHMDAITLGEIARAMDGNYELARAVISRTNIRLNAWLTNVSVTDIKSEEVVNRISKEILLQELKRGFQEAKR